ncbi:MAG: nucleotidyltransferase domain-containing protein [Oscillospiraceae bacterium]|nr:nucleotidyltransferase domain-containing protein [Oscillospiraceae bacterium]
MIDINIWMERFMRVLRETFPDRVWFVGLQGSYARGEATEDSDIDVVVIFDFLSTADIYRYRDMLDTLPDREKICGFLSGKDEILHWDPSDLFQFCHDTVPICGSLEDVLVSVDDAAVESAVRIAACNIYHGCVHNMLHDKSEEVLRGLYKAASFAVQAIVYRQTGRYVRFCDALLNEAKDEDRGIIETFVALKAGGNVAFDPMSEMLLSWAKRWLCGKS